MSNAIVDAYIVGTQKSGTTSLFDWLAQHPEVNAPIAVKDFPAFSINNELYPRTTKLESLFNDSDKSRKKLRLGADANLVYSSNGIANLSKKSPHCKIILLLRKPEERCFSAWKFARERLLEERSFEEAIASELTGNCYPDSSYEGLQMNYLDHSRYVQQYEKINRHFRPDQVMLVTFEKLTTKSPQTIKEICTFLGIDDHFEFDFVNTNESSSGSRSKAISKLLYRRNKNDWKGKILSLLTTQHFRAAMRRKLRKLNRSSKKENLPRPDEKTLHRIREHLKMDVEFHQLLRDQENENTAHQQL